jgi:hypothetical protein
MFYQSRRFLDIGCQFHIAQREHFSIFHIE